MIIPLPNPSERLLRGIGVGVRDCHIPHLLNHSTSLNWLEIVSDNYMVEGGPLLEQLAGLRQLYPLAMHGVGMSIGSTDSLNKNYINHLRQLADWIKPGIISDHLCWISVNQQYFHELLPLPYTQEAIDHVVDRIKTIQSLLNRRITVENVSSYITYQQSEMTEWEFLSAVAEQSDCGILLDINNIYVSSYNHDFDPLSYIDSIPPERVHQIHLAGFEEHDSFLLDGHNASVHDDVWQLYRHALRRLGPVPTLIEWDKNIPEFDQLEQEAAQARQIMEEETGRPHETVT